jgi:hypothetical protein
MQVLNSGRISECQPKNACWLLTLKIFKGENLGVNKSIWKLRDKRKAGFKKDYQTIDHIFTFMLLLKKLDSDPPKSFVALWTSEKPLILY